MFLVIFAFGCLLFSLYHSGKLFVNVIRGYLELRKMDGYRYPGIKCENMSFSVMSYVVSVCLEGVVTYCCIQMKDTVEQLGIMWSVWMFRGLIVVSILTILTKIFI